MQQHATITDMPFKGGVDLTSNTRSRRRPIHGMLVSFSAAYFAGALVTDLVYWQTLNVLWERFSIWLIVAGLVMAGLAVIAYVIDFFAGRQIDRPALPRAVGYALAVLISLINAFVHSRDGYTAVVPTGLMLSAIVLVVLLLTAAVGKISGNRSRVGDQK
jgi:uncharacterized membrane protein